METIVFFSVLLFNYFSENNKTKETIWLKLRLPISTQKEEQRFQDLSWRTLGSGRGQLGIGKGQVGIR